MKKIVIYSSSGGGGHVSVSNALHDYLKNSYSVTVTYLFKEILYPLDPTYYISATRLHGERIYNFFMRRKWYHVLTNMYKLGKWYFNLRSNKVRSLIKKHLITQKADLVISVIPVVNNHIQHVCNELNIPLVIVPTDLDIRTFVDQLDQHITTTITLPFKDSHITQVLHDKNVSTCSITITGFPLRSDFYEPKNIMHIKQSLGLVLDNRPIILIMMGSVGNNDMYTYAQSLQKLHTPAQLIFVLGKNEQLKAKLEQLVFPGHIHVCILGFTREISNLMAIATLVITKSGTVSVCEALYMQVPMLLDGSYQVPVWEQLNHALVMEHKWGGIIYDIATAHLMVDEFLQSPSLLSNTRHHMTPLKNTYPPAAFQELIANLLS